MRILDSQDFRLKEIDVGDDGAGRPLSAARDRQRGVALGAVHDGRVVMGVVDDPMLEAGDRLLVLDPEQR